MDPVQVDYHLCFLGNIRCKRTFTQCQVLTLDLSCKSALSFFQSMFGITTLFLVSGFLWCALIQVWQGVYRDYIDGWKEQLVNQIVPAMIPFTGGAIDCSSIRLFFFPLHQYCIHE